MQTGKSLANEYGVVQGLFKGLFWRVALISTTFFLVNTFKQQTVPLLFPHAVQDEPEKKWTSFLHPPMVTVCHEDRGRNPI